MKWSNLKNNKCPQCNRDFIVGLKTYPVNNEQMLAHGCGFKIRESRYSEIVSSGVTADLDRGPDKEMDEEL